MPVLYLNKESVPQADIDAEKEVLAAQIKNDEKNANKPQQIIEKLVSGKIGKFYEKNCLTEQAYVKDRFRVCRSVCREYREGIRRARSLLRVLVL